SLLPDRTTPLIVFFFSSRRRHTRFSRDWSSDVCSSDLQAQVQLHHLGIDAQEAADFQRLAAPILYADARFRARPSVILRGAGPRSEERRVGKECGRQRSQDTEKQNIYTAFIASRVQCPH